METQTIEEKIAEVENDLKEAKAEYRAVKERNPDDPRLDRLYQGVLNCQQLLHDLYVEKRLHQEQQALRETPAGNSLPSFFFCSSIIHVFVLFICI